MRIRFRIRIPNTAISHVGIFDPSCDLGPANLLTGSPAPAPSPLPGVNKCRGIHSYSV
jgi:hypothetical protein